MNINNKNKIVNIDDIFNNPSTDANVLFATCCTPEDKGELKKFANRYLDEFYFIRNANGKSVILKPVKTTKTIKKEDGTEASRDSLRYIFISHRDFKESCIKDHFQVKQLNRFEKMEVKKINYADFWIDTKTELCRSFESTVFDPSPDFNDDTVFNMWTGYVEPKKGSIQPFLDHIKNLINDPIQEDHLIKLIAYTVRYPNVQVGTSLVFMGIQGCGKTTISETIREMCPNHSSVVADLERDLLGQFNEEYVNTKYFLHEESSWAGDKKTANKLKDMITGETRKSGIKYMNGLVLDNYGFHIFTSNSDNPINVENGDRRFNIFSCSSKMVGNSKYFKEYYAWLKTDGKHALVHYFKNEIDLSGFDPMKILKSTAHDLVKANNLNPVNKYLLELLRTEIEWNYVDEKLDGSTLSYYWENNPIKISRNMAYEGFMEFCQDHSESGKLRDWTQSKFTAELAKIFKFPSGFNSNWKNKGVSFYKLPELEICRTLFCENIGATEEGIFGTSQLVKKMKMMVLDNKKKADESNEQKKIDSLGVKNGK